uniref:Putative ml domain protein n=1 Tax=Aedes albopictus TaxID=7160 RepID=A0A023EGW6_AEDAL
MEVKLTLLVVSLLVSAVVGQLEVQKCKKGAIPNKLEIEGCTKAPCQIVNGQNLRFNAEFTNPKATKTLTAKVIARVAGLIIPYELPAEHRDGCKKLTNAKCPLADNQSVEAAGDVPVDSPISNVKANIEFQLHADSGVAVCFKIDAKIVK